MTKARVSSSLFVASLAVVQLFSHEARAVSCTLVSVGSLTFSEYRWNEPRSGVASTTLIYRCTSVKAGDAISVELSTGASNSYLLRQMVGKDRLSYNVFLDAQWLTVWGDGYTGGSHRYAALLRNGALVSVPIYARILPNQRVSAGSYSDAIVVTVNF